MRSPELLIPPRPEIKRRVSWKVREWRRAIRRQIFRAQIGITQIGREWEEKRFARNERRLEEKAQRRLEAIRRREERERGRLEQKEGKAQEFISRAPLMMGIAQRVITTAPQIIEEEGTKAAEVARSLGLLGGGTLMKVLGIISRFSFEAGQKIGDAIREGGRLLFHLIKLSFEGRGKKETPSTPNAERKK